MATSKPTAPVKPALKAPVAAPAKPGPAPAKPAPQKPQVAAPAAKPAPQKPAVAAPAKPAPAKPAPSAPAKAPAAAPAAPAKPGPAKPVQAPAKGPAEASGQNAVQAELKAWIKEATESFEALNTRLTAMEVAMQRVNGAVFQNTELDDEGNVVLDLENADVQTLANWFFQMGYDATGQTVDSMRQHMQAMRAAGQPFDFVNEIPEGGAPLDGIVGEEGEAAAEEEEAVEVTEADIAKMNWAALTELAGRLGVDFSDIGKTPQPKVLRGRLVNALAAGSEAPEADENGFYEGAPVLVSHEGTDYPATFVGNSDTEGEVVIEWPEADAEGNSRVSIDASIVKLAEEGLEAPRCVSGSHSRAQYGRTP